MSEAISVAMFAARVVDAPGPGSWFVLLVPSLLLTTTAGECLSKLSLFGDAQVLACKPSGPEDLVTTSKENDTKLLLISEVEHFSEEDWYGLDLLRSRLERTGNVVLLLSEEALKKLVHCAPNLMSWIGGSVWSFKLSVEDLSEEEIEARLTYLRIWSGRDDRWVLDAARNKTLPTDPEYAEWLVLLNHGDLLDR